LSKYVAFAFVSPLFSRCAPVNHGPVELPIKMAYAPDKGPKALFPAKRLKYVRLADETELSPTKTPLAMPLEDMSKAFPLAFICPALCAE